MILLIDNSNEVCYIVHRECKRQGVPSRCPAESKGKRRLVKRCFSFFMDIFLLKYECFHLKLLDICGNISP